MTVGTKSLLFGVHQFAWHPFTVLLAWRRLYGLPTWRVAVCVLVHDWGYWGCGNMDGDEGQRHPLRGARIAHRLFGIEAYDLVLLHSRSMARRTGHPPSQLCWPDKLCVIFDPEWFYLLRARASGEIREYRANAHSSGFVDRAAPDSQWYRALIRNSIRVADENAAGAQHPIPSHP